MSRFFGPPQTTIDSKEDIAIQSKGKFSKRLLYLGRTPGKGSKTGKAVFDRMLKEGNARVLPNGKKMFKDATSGEWYSICPLPRKRTHLKVES